MKLLPEYLGGGAQQMDRAVPDSIRWALAIGLVTVPIGDLMAAVDVIREADGLLTMNTRDGIDTISVSPIPLTRGPRTSCADHGDRLIITATSASARWRHIKIEMGRLKDGRGTQPGDALALADTMRESLAAAKSLLRQIDRSGDPLCGRLQHHWLREIAAVASLQAGGMQEDRVQPVVSASSPLMGEVANCDDVGWRPSPAMRRHIDMTVGNSACIQTYEGTKSIGGRKGFDLFVSILPHQVRAQMPNDPMDGMRKIGRMMPADAEWVEIMP